jgi:hypothetical protein
MYLIEAVPDRNLRSARQKYPELDSLQRPNFSQKLQNDLNVILIFTFIKSVNNNGISRSVIFAVKV